MANTPTTLKTTRIYKKINSTPEYWLYHPQTGGNQVLINSNNVAGGYTTTNWLDVDGGTSTTADSTHCYTPLEPYLAWMAKQIDDFGGVLEFKGTSSFANLPTGTSGDNRKGEVYILTEKLYWSSTGGANTWSTYPTNTLFVCVGTDTGANYINTSASSTGAKYQWVPLGGQNDIYATKAQAIGTVTLSGATLHVGSVDGTTISRDITFPTVGTTAANTAPITSDIPNASDNAIPNVAAVKAYAGSAGRVNAVTATSGYLTVISANTAGTYTVGVVSISVTNGQTNTPTLGANISGKAATAGTSDKVKASFTVAGQAFDGSAAKTISVGNGLTTTTSGNTTTISVGEGDGITVDENGISVNVGNGLAYSNDQIVATATAGLTVTAGGIGISNSITSGVYSAVAVNQYGLATAGGQAVVFAPNLSSDDLHALVVGGGAFIGSGETGNNSTGTTPITDNIS